MSVRGRDLVVLLAKLDAIEAELIMMCQWLDRDDSGGNARTSSLLDGAAIRVGAAWRQAMRAKEAQDAEQAREAQEQAQAQAEAGTRWRASQGGYGPR